MFSFDETNEEGISWPSYVDFMSTFIFILIIFLGSLVYLMAGSLRQQEFIQQIGPSIVELKALQKETNAGVDFHVDAIALKVYITLKGQIIFKTGCPNDRRDDCPKTLPVETTETLRKVGKIIAQNPHCTRVVIEGRADSQKVYRRTSLGKLEEDPFGNWELSTNRATEVLKFFWNCTDCGYDANLFRPKFTLSGLGEQGPNPEERRVDVTIDYSSGHKE